jgi:hypothetical protein
MIYSNQLLVFDRNITSEISAIYGNDSSELSSKVAVLVNKEMYKVVKQIKRILDDFLKKVGTELQEIDIDVED